MNYKNVFGFQLSPQRTAVSVTNTLICFYSVYTTIAAVVAAVEAQCFVTHSDTNLKETHLKIKASVMLKLLPILFLFNET